MNLGSSQFMMVVGIEISTAKGYNPCSPGSIFNQVPQSLGEATSYQLPSRVSEEASRKLQLLEQQGGRWLLQCGEV